MTRYDFQDESTGEVVELVYPMATVPNIGDVVERDGRRLRRLVSRVEVSTERFIPHTSTSLPLGDPASTKFDSMGAPVFETRADVDERIARAKDIPGAVQTRWE